MSLRPDHVEAARPGLWSGPSARVASLFDAVLVHKRADWALMPRAGARLERSSPAMESGGGHMGNVGRERAAVVFVCSLRSW